MAVTVAQAVAKIEVQGDSEAKSKISSVKKTVDDASGGFRGALKNALDFAAGLGLYNVASQAVNFFKDQVTDTVKVTMHHADVMAQTAQVIKSTGDASGLSAQQIADMADSLSKVTDFSQDTTESGENLLLTFTGIGKDVFPQATKTMLDMSQAMGQDVKSSAIQLGKALNDPAQGLTALTRVGVTFSDKQKEMIQHMVAVGDTAGAQKIMLQELQREFGGSAEAAGKTFGGQLEILKNKFEDLKIKVGTAVMPILSQLFSFISSTVLPGLEHFGSLISKVWSILDDEGLGVLIASFQNLANTIGTALSPVLTPLANTFKNLFSDSSVISGAHNLEGSFYNIASGVDNLSNGIKQLTAFFQSNSIQAQIVKDLMVGIGIAIVAIKIGQFVSTIPALITSFQLWAAGAWEAAAGTIAATWPLLAIGAVIAIVVAGIILAIQHWGEIVKFLQGIWGAFSSWFMGILGAIGNFFHNIWDGIVSGIQAAWTFIINIVRAGAALLLAIVLGPIYLIANAFVWLYNHNYYFKALVDAIVNFFKGLFDWAIGAWNGFIGWIGGVWNGLVGLASAIWNRVSTAIRIGFFAAIAFVQSIWNSISTTFSNAWNTYIAGPLAALWTNVSSFFSGVWTNYIAGPIGSLWNQLSSTVSGWAKSAVDWGSNLINGFINGIKNAAAGVGNAIAGVADQVKNFLGFHSPAKMGPGAEADVWAPNFMKMYAKGITDNIPLIHSAMNQVMKPISVNMNASTTLSTSSGATQFPSMRPVSPSSSSQPQQVNLQIDSQTFARLVLPAFTNQIRHNVGVWDM